MAEFQTYHCQNLELLFLGLSTLKFTPENIRYIDVSLLSGVFTYIMIDISSYSHGIISAYRSVIMNDNVSDLNNLFE